MSLPSLRVIFEFDSNYCVSYVEVTCCIIANWQVLSICNRLVYCLVGWYSVSTINTSGSLNLFMESSLSLKLSSLSRLSLLREKSSESIIEFSESFKFIFQFELWVVYYL